MGSSQLYSLTWGEFGTSLVSAVQLLRCHGDLVDVTLAAGGRSFPAHKIVLCAASPFLLNLLKSTPCQHPVVMLAGVTAPDLEALLEFVYRGEVSVDPNQLPSLLQAAHCLNIQGLAPGTISSEKPEELSAVSSAHDALTRDVINTFLPIRRRKRTKRRNSSGSGGKWARQDNMAAADAENRPMEQQSASATGGVGGSGVPMSSEQDVLSIPDVPRKSEETDAHTQTGEEAASPLLLATDLGGGKMRGASEQPGVCPLCGSMLRQARNLRRHLLTSCKYRMMGTASQYLSALFTQPSSSSQPQVLPLQPPSLTAPLILHSPGNETCEQIVCKVSPISSPLASPVPSPDTLYSSAPSICDVMTTTPPSPPPPILRPVPPPSTPTPPPPPPPPPSTPSPPPTIHQ